MARDKQGELCVGGGETEGKNMAMLEQRAAGTFETRHNEGGDTMKRVA